MGSVLRALREYRGLSLEETAQLVGVSAANLSRTERGLPGGLHPRHLERIAALLGTSTVGLFALTEALTKAPQLLHHPEELAAYADRLVAVQQAYLKVSGERRREVDRLLGI